MDGFITFLYIFMLAAFVGFEVISRVPVILHTPLLRILLIPLQCLARQTRRPHNWVVRVAR